MSRTEQKQAEGRFLEFRGLEELAEYIGLYYPEEIHAPEGKARLYTAAEIRAAAADGLQIWLDVGRRWPRIPCRMAATVRGWVTAAGEHGAIYQAWAGDFHGSPSPAEIVTT